MRFSALLLASLLFAAAPLTAQQGTVIGHVYCADTNAPARFAKVLLKSTAPNPAGQAFMNQLQSNIEKMAAKTGSSAPEPPDTAQQRRAKAAAADGMNRVTEMMNASTVGLDGSFRVPNIKPGTYYIRALLAGYLDPVAEITDADLTSTDSAVRARLAQLPTVTITGNSAASASSAAPPSVAASSSTTAPPPSAGPSPSSSPAAPTTAPRPPMPRWRRPSP
jgi:hypothetical protein